MKFKGAGIELEFNKTTFGVERASITGDPTDFCFVKGKNFALPSGNNFLLKSEFEGGVFKAEFLYFNDMTAKVSVEEKNASIAFSYVFKNEGKKKISLEEGEIGFFASFNDGGAEPDLSVKRRLHAHVRVGGSFAHVFPVRNSGSGPVIALLMTKGRVPSYSVERGVKKDDRGEILFNFPALSLEPGETYEAAFSLFIADGRWDFEDKKFALGAPDIRAYGLCGFEGEALTVRAPEGTALVTEKGSLPFDDGECSVALEGSGEKKASVRAHDELFELTYYVLSRDLAEKRARYLLENQYVKEGPFKGAFCAFDPVRKEQVFKKKPSSPFSFAGERASALLFLLSSLNSGEKFSEEILSAVEDSIAFYDKEVFSDGDFSERADKKKSKYLKDFAEYPLYAAIQYEAYLYKKDVSRLIESAAILMDYYRKGRDSFTATNVCSVYDALRKEGKDAVASALKTSVVTLADKVLASGNRYGLFKGAAYTPELIAGALSLMTDAAFLSENDYYLVPAEDHLARLKAFSAPSLSYAEDFVPLVYRENRSTGRSVDYSPYYSNSLVALVFARYAIAAKKDKYFLIAKKIVKACLTLFKEDGSASRGRSLPKTVNDVAPSAYEEISFGEDLILYHFNLLFMRRSLII